MDPAIVTLTGGWPALTPELESVLLSGSGETGGFSSMGLLGGGGGGGGVGGGTSEPLPSGLLSKCDSALLSGKGETGRTSTEALRSGVAGGGISL